tara:strand:+ start:396 stop:563 length:168 start_codon:yes stop_codon:yes gene_type:complete
LQALALPNSEKMRPIMLTYYFAILWTEMYGCGEQRKFFFAICQQKRICQFDNRLS